MTVLNEAVQWGGQYLKDQGLESPMVEVEAILSGLLNISPSQLYLNSRQELPGDVEQLFKSLISRRSQHEPVAYLLGSKNFYGLDFKIDRSVLIPRPETEMLVEHVLEGMGTGVTNILEIGTGSGCIAVTLARKEKSASVVATDVSEGALRLARLNAENHGVAEKIHFFRSDLYQGLDHHWKGYFDIILSNPPYISSSKLSFLDPDLHFEPRLALDGGADGFLVVKPLIENAREFLKPTGKLLIEIGFDQGEEAVRLFKNSGFTDIELLKDFSGHDRIVSGKRNGSI